MLLLLAALVSAVAAMSATAQDTFTPLGDLAGGGFNSHAYGVNSGGSVVVGFGTRASGQEAFRWTQSGGMVSLGDLPGGIVYSVANDVNSDGSVVVGYGHSAGGSEAFRWTQAGMVSLGNLPGGTYSAAYGVNSDGSVVVGYGNRPGGTEAFRWTQTGGMVGLGDLPGGIFSSIATDINSDGSVVVGSGAIAGGNEAFRWTQAGGMVGLGDLPGGDFMSAAYGVNSNGSVVVGEGTSASGTEAFRWTQAEGTMVGLGDLPGGDFWSRAYGVNSDGSVVVGSSKTASALSREAFIWTQATGMRRLVDWLAAAGVTVAPGYTMTYARGVSADGSVVVGESDGPSGMEAFIARVSAIGSGAITLSDLENSLNSIATGSSYVVLAPGYGMAINGAHSRPLARRVGAGKKTFWVAGDWGTDDHGARSGDLGLIEMGGGLNFGPAQLNVSLGQTWAEQNLTLDGRAEADGTYLLTEALIPVSGNLWATVGGYGHWGKADLRRGYLNAGTQDYSAGEPGVDTWGLRVRLDLENAVTLSGAGLTPYADFTYSEAKLDAYTESGGGFPARFDSRKDKVTDLRVGLNAGRPISVDVRLVGTLEATHRFEKAGARTTGQVIGLFGFDIAGTDFKQDWLRAGIGVEGKLAEGTASLMLNATTEGEMPNLWLAASWQIVF